MDAEQFSLSWNNFHSHLSSGFQSLLQSEDLVDVTLAVDGRYIKAHKTVLSICSPYFTDLFRANPCKHPIVIMQGTTYNILHSLLQFIYKGEVSVTQEEIPMFMKLAETLKIKGLTEKEEATPSNGLQDAPTIDTKHTLDSDRHVMKRNKLPKPKPYTKPVDTVTIPQHVTDTRIEQEFPLIAKIEPVDVPDEEDYRYNTDSYDDEQHPVDISHMSETSMTLGEPSEPDNYFKSSQDISSSGPGTLQCVLGKRGLPRLLLDGHTFMKKSVYKNKCYWFCRGSRDYAKCSAVCWTVDGEITKWPQEHTHPVIQDYLHPTDDRMVPIEHLKQVLMENTLN